MDVETYTIQQDDTYAMCSSLPISTLFEEDMNIREH